MILAKVWRRLIPGGRWAESPATADKREELHRLTSELLAEFLALLDSLARLSAQEVGCTGRLLFPVRVGFGQ